MSGIIIPHTAISSDALRGVVEEFVSREGTDYGSVEYSFERKVADVMKQLADGRACLVFDPTTESCDIVVKGSLRYRQIVATQSEGGAE